MSQGMTDEELQAIEARATEFRTACCCGGVGCRRVWAHRFDDDTIALDSVILIDEVRRQRAEARHYHDELVWLQTTKDEDRELRYTNQGADMAATKLLAIVETGKHVGVFGGHVLEAAAQAILKLHAETRRLIEAAEALLSDLDDRSLSNSMAFDDLASAVEACKR